MQTLTDLRELLPDALQNRSGAFHLLQSGVPVRRPYKQLDHHVHVAADTLRGWGVAPGVRVGIFAANSYEWIVHDLAVLTLGAILVPFTEDFRGTINEKTLERYGIRLLLISAGDRKGFFPRPPHVAFIDAPNTMVTLRADGEPADLVDRDCLTRVFSSGSSGGLKDLIISGKGVASTLPPLLEALQVKAQDRLLLFLPLSNFQQRYLIYGALWKDFDIILTDYTQLFTAMAKLKPTILLAPPVLYEMVHDEFARGSIWKWWSWTAASTALSLVPG